VEPRFPEPHLRDEFRRELRARLMHQAVTALAPRTRATAWAFLRPALGVGLAGFILVAGASTAAAGSVAGDTTFPLKKAFEDIQVTLTFDDVQRVELLSQIADRRLRELQQVANHDDGNVTTASEEFAKAVTKFRAAADQVQTAGSPAKSEKVQKVVDAARDTHAAVVNEIQDQVSDDKAKDALDRALDAEDKDTAQEQNGGGNDPKRPARPARTPRTSNERTLQTPKPSPRETEHQDQQPTPTPRTNSTPRSNFNNLTPAPPAPPARQGPDVERD
jgi:hypothetical protein